MRADFIGVHSQKSNKKTTFSELSAKPKKRYFFVWETTDGRFYVQAINAAYDPIEDEYHLIDSQDYRDNYKQEPYIFAAPLMQFQAPERPQTVFESALYDEKLVPKKPAKLPIGVRTENELRNKFSDQILFLRNGKVHEATSAIQGILATKNGIMPSHKHMFTDFGIVLRKEGQLHLALAAFERANVLKRDDVNTYFNIARIYYELKHYDRAWQYVVDALRIEPRHMELNQLRQNLVQLSALKITL